MDIQTAHTGKPQLPPSKLLLWITFLLYIILLALTVAHHELWGDEIHSWNIAKASAGFADLIANTRYEGHPPVWYIILWAVSKFTHDVHAIQVAQFIIATLVVYVVLFFSPFPTVIKLLIPFGYYFLFEYGTLSRNYAVGVLPALCICIVLHKEFKYKMLLYYALLFILSNTHLLAVLLACSLHGYFLLLHIEQKKKPGAIILHGITGVLVILPALYFIFPPHDSGLNTGFWLDRLDIHQLTSSLFQPALRAFIPVPAWWQYNSWNTQFLIEAQVKFSLLKIINVGVLLTLFLVVFFILRRNKKSLFLFTANLLLTLFVSVFLPLTTARYAGFIFIGFIAAYWLYCAGTPIHRLNIKLVGALLVIQLTGAAFIVTKDIQLPFSNGYTVKELLNEVPAGKKTVTDYWALNALAAFTDKPFYCVEMHKEMSFLMWTTELTKMTQSPNAWSNGMNYLFQKEGLQQAYMISIHSPGDMAKKDTLLFKDYHVKLIDKREGAIEKGGNIYLYQVSAF